MSNYFEVLLRSNKLDKRNNEKPLTLRQLKDLLNTLDDNILDQDAWVWNEKGSNGLYQIIQLTEDMINPSGEGVEPVSIYTDDMKTDKEKEEFLKEEEVIFKKGFVIFDMID